MNLKEILETIGDSANRHSQTIMAVAAVGGLIATTVLTYKKSGKIKRTIAANKVAISDVEHDDTLTDEEVKKEKKAITKNTIKELIPDAGPVIGCAVLTSGLMIASAVTSEIKIGNLTSLAASADLAYRELFEKTKEVAGEETAKEIQDKINQDHINASQGDYQREHPIDAKGGNYLCYDAMSGRYFYSDKETIRAAVNTINNKITSGQEDYESLNDLYYELGLPCTGCGEDRGIGRRCNIETLELNLSNAILSDTGEPALVMDFLSRPVLGFKGF